MDQKFFYVYGCNERAYALANQLKRDVFSCFS